MKITVLGRESYVKNIFVFETIKWYNCVKY